MKRATLLTTIVVCYGLTSPAVSGPNGFYCRRSGEHNMHFKCVTTPCNGTSCETVVDHVDDDEPDVVMDSNRKLSVRLETENVSTVHVLVINYVRHYTCPNDSYRLVKPVILKLELAAPGQLYQLRLVNYVNGGPTEEVISKTTRANYDGCNADKARPTCGVQYYGLSEPVPFSEGFCCSCLASVNAARQPRPAGGRTAAAMPAAGRVTLRGDPDCANVTAGGPGYADRYTYHESSHCFRYSDLWFDVYAADASRAFVPLTVQLFDKHDDRVRRRSSASVTNARTARFAGTNRDGPIRRSADGGRIASRGPVRYRYRVDGLNGTAVVNDLSAVLVLIPQRVPAAYRSALPRMDLDDPRNYLLVRPEWMSADDAECDKIGVQPRAFYEQPERCYRPAGSCLDGGRQPERLLREAAAAAASGGRRRALFVGDHVRGAAAVRFDRESQQLIVDGRVSPLTAADGATVRGVGEIALDDNAVIVHDRVLLQLSEIHAVSDHDDDDHDDHDASLTVRVYVTNLGLTTAEFFVEAVDADHRRTAAREFRRPSVVRPQQTAEVHLTMTCRARRCNAIVRLYDATERRRRRSSPAASRKFHAVRGSRCYCLWHRRCECHRAAYASDDDDDDDDNGDGDGGSYGDALNSAEYAEAGFAGDVPPGTAAAEMAALGRATVRASLTALAAYLAAALALGLLKDASPRHRARWLWMVGSDWLSDMDAYKEPELRPLRMVRDARGYYVHPVTGSRDVRLLDRGQEFVTNVLFFVNLPATLCRHYVASLDYSACGTTAAVPAAHPN